MDLVDKSLQLKCPKTVLHLHIEGTLEPELMFFLAKKNNISIPFKSVEEVKQAYKFSDLQSFLDMYYAGCNVLITEDDFFQLAVAYFNKVSTQGVRHVEMFFDAQTHTMRNIAFETVLNGLVKAQNYAKEKFNISSFLIMCFLRHLSQEEAFVTQEDAIKHKDKIIGIGQDSGEKGNPPTKFVEVYQKARSEGFRMVAHCGEEGPPQNIWDGLKQLNCERIDHGVACQQDEEQMDYQAQNKIPLTCCPLSNLKLCVYKDLKEFDQNKMLEKGICVTINSDDPAYFGGYCMENYEAIIDAGLVKNNRVLRQLVINGIKASFLDNKEKQELITETNNLFI